jgi:quercetin dioxygenase-like cupin family protein
MSTTTAAPTCLYADGSWKERLDEGQVESRFLEGDFLRNGVTTFQQGQSADAVDGELGEEVAAVLKGEFLIEAAGERYELGTGEGIVIPPHEPRRWTCLSADGALYRACVRLR